MLFFFYFLFFFLLDWIVLFLSTAYMSFWGLTLCVRVADHCLFFPAPLYGNSCWLCQISLLIAKPPKVFDRAVLAAQWSPMQSKQELPTLSEGNRSAWSLRKRAHGWKLSFTDFSSLVPAAVVSWAGPGTLTWPCPHLWAARTKVFVAPFWPLVEVSREDGPIGKQQKTQWEAKAISWGNWNETPQ